MEGWFTLFKIPSPTFPSPTFPVPGGDIGIMSVYQPFPLRIEGQQYDACFQIGEFSMLDGTGVGTGIVILIPLKVSANIGKGGTFVNAFASSIPNILGGTPDILTGFPDVQVTGLTGWNVADILQSDRPFYTWTNKDGTRVIVMAEAVGIADGDMTNIKRLPITPPGDVMHEIADKIFYKPAPPIDCAGNPIMCRKPFNIVQPKVNTTTGALQSKQIMDAFAGFFYLIIVVIGIWLALMWATGSGAGFLKGLGDRIGGAFAGIRLPTRTSAPVVPTTDTMTPEERVKKAAAAKKAAMMNEPVKLQSNPMNDKQPRPTPAEQAAAAGVGRLT